ncbi:MAG TPA: hypothetical protein VMW69_14290 [Spirochaetia bacterium]|nr:hypothetical protein [Spirochaetia bacterium]
MGLFFDRLRSRENQVRVELFGALRAKTVREFRLGVKLKVGVDGAPKPFVVPDPFAGGADRDNPAKGFDFVYGGPEVELCSLIVQDYESDDDEDARREG